MQVYRQLTLQVAAAVTDSSAFAAATAVSARVAHFYFYDVRLRVCVYVYVRGNEITQWAVKIFAPLHEITSFEAAKDNSYTYLYACMFMRMYVIIH